MTQSSQSTVINNPYVLGFVRASLMFPLEHFVDMTKVAAQKTPEISSGQVIQTIYKEKGFKGFFIGSYANYPRRVLRDTIRWPIIGHCYHQLTKNFPELFPEKSTISFVFSGLAAAAFDSLVLGPLELLMANRIKEEKSYGEFFQKRFIQQGVPSLYRGSSVNFAYRSAVWGMYMGVNSEMNKLFASPNKNKLPSYAKEFASSVVTSTALVATLLPVDFVKSHIQMDSNLQGKKISLVVQTLLKRHGALRFYAGAPIVWINNIVYGLVFQKIITKTIDALKGRDNSKG